MTELRLWPLLGTCSRRAILRRTKKFGHPYTYKPRGDLIIRLSRQTGLTYAEVFSQLLREREELLRDRD
ncbi:hypothetical protein H6F67_10970 [Microcoleus sp. FACHB-1515]|uniref:hypothetical protein n=1 Tax=Cyanophyceae TaxID=3028117 RepID=UPI0016887E9B|nr:hypothetical protein [Microcoleus sp. FACHB-1515]MBD2090376.1 hypothetical protein [Microcoleus sp. FACHB-1515]